QAVGSKYLPTMPSAKPTEPDTKPFPTSTSASSTPLTRNSRRFREHGGSTTASHSAARKPETTPAAHPTRQPTTANGGTPPQTSSATQPGSHPSARAATPQTPDQLTRGQGRDPVPGSQLRAKRRLVNGS